jgi:uncharacterized protein YndB with AHSA1/START domain
MSDNIREDSRVTGKLRIDDGRGTVHVEGLYDTDIDDLWSALTEPERAARWIAAVDGDLSLGGVFHARFTSTWDGMIRVDACDAPRRLLLTSEPGDPAEAVIEALLSPEGDKTRLVIEERGFELDEYAAHGAGWQAHLEDLDDYLAGREKRDWAARWTELSPSYNRMAAELA